MPNEKTIAASIILIAIAIIFFIAHRRQSGLLKNSIFCHGKVKDISSRYKDPGVGFIYTFKNIRGMDLEKISFVDCRLSNIKNLRSSLVNAMLPVVYDSLNFDNAFMILSRSMAKRFHVEENLSDSDLKLMDSIQLICNN